MPFSSSFFCGEAFTMETDVSPLIFTVPRAFQKENPGLTESAFLFPVEIN
jgi:hypothetical protein